MAFPRSTHQWLRHVYAALNGRIPLSLGSPTGPIGLYGASGGLQLATGTAGTTGWTGVGGASLMSFWVNGGSGTYYQMTDVVTALKNVGILKP